MKNFKKQFIIKALPEDVYAALTNPEIITIWTGEETVMEATPGSEFSWWNGDICGKNIEFETGKKIVQQWYFGEEDEEPASIVTLKMHPDKKGTSLEVNHTNIPDDAYDNIAEGWEDAIVVALRELMEE
jgi:uncharacterized protein YndB with AHSA1/START domain